MASPKAAKIPAMIYGTAWKKDQTRALVKQALFAGFRGIDTAAQPKHYQEDLVGDGIRDAITEGVVKREDLYIQTKFTSINGQDPGRLPYDPSDSIANQVKTSVTSSIQNLRPSTDTASSQQSYIDCLVLHSPFPTVRETQEAWRAMELHVPLQARTLGISNVYQVEVLGALYESAAVKPVVVQNRFHAATGYDTEIRAFCGEKGMQYESFWTLTANPKLLKARMTAVVAEKAGVSLPVALYGLVLSLGSISVLNGTTNAEHMREDIVGIEKVQEWIETSAESREVTTAFRSIVDA